MQNTTIRIQDLIDSGELHHVSLRNKTSLWEGLYFYRKDVEGYRGFKLAETVLKDHPEFNAVLALCTPFGIRDLG
jgi:hypothetical protein